MALGGQGSGSGPGMPGALGRPPGWRRRGCRRPPRTGRTARSRRSATRPPHQAGPVRSRHGGLLRPAPRTGPSCFPGRGRCIRARTARVVPPGAESCGPAPTVGGTFGPCSELRGEVTLLDATDGRGGPDHATAVELRGAQASLDVLGPEILDETPDGLRGPQSIAVRRDVREDPADRDIAGDGPS